jgi:hypothetical protein
MGGGRMSGGAEVAKMLDPYVGLKIAGGCDHCDAYQTVERLGRPSPDSPGHLEAWHRVAAEMGMDTDGPGVYFTTVHHDDDCPDWLQRQNRAIRRAAHKRTKRKRYR